MTSDQTETLKPYESYLRTAVRSNYVRSLPMKDAKLLADIYISLGHTKPNLSCGKCVLNMCKVLGREYFS